MRIFIAFQNKNYTQERIGNILWCANRCMDGYEQYYYINLKRLQRGDIVYNMDDGRLMSISFVEQDAEGMKRPTVLEKTPWGDEGIGVNVQYHDLSRPLKLTAELIETINEICGSDNSPFTDSLSPKHGYIFEIPYKAHKKLVKQVLVFNNIDKLQGKMLSDDDIELINSIEENLSKCENEDERKDIINNDMLRAVIEPRKSRLFRTCTICGADHMDMLSAVYIKPWDSATITERLDLNNVIMLCPNHKYLFENGLISFNDMGIIMISDNLSYTNYKPMVINLFTSINLTAKEFEYISWHRDNIFDKGIKY